MFLTNKTLASFTQALAKRAFNILTHEMGLTVHRRRVEYQGRLYPLHFVVFEHPRELGHFDARYFSIGINKTLAYRGDQQLIDNLLRHELAHFMTYLLHGLEVSPHGPEFHSVCQRMGYGPEVSSAKLEQSEVDLLKLDDERTRLIEKVQKLLRLSESLNPHEASLATLKANELLTKYNLDHAEDFGDETDSCRARVLEMKRRDAKSDAIVDILKECQVEALYAQGQGVTAIEVIGARASVEAADYLAKFLHHELERLLKLERKKAPELKGLKARQAFFYGVARGYTQKLQEQNRDHYTGRELLILKDQLNQHLSRFYPRLRSVKTATSQDAHARHKGIEVGRQLSLNRGLHPRRGPALLGY